MKPGITQVDLVINITLHGMVNTTWCGYLGTNMRESLSVESLKIRTYDCAIVPRKQLFKILVISDGDSMNIVKITSYSKGSSC